MVEHITEENSYSRTPKLMFYKVITFAVKKPYIHIIENKTLRCFIVNAVDLLIIAGMNEDEYKKE